MGQRTAHGESPAYRGSSPLGAGGPSTEHRSAFEELLAGDLAARVRSSYGPFLRLFLLVPWKSERIAHRHARNV
jgi:hypothetical protein